MTHIISIVDFVDNKIYSLCPCRSSKNLLFNLSVHILSKECGALSNSLSH
jgi:hypothetical protein